MKPISFNRHHFPPDIIAHAIWLYARFTLSFRDVEEMFPERGLDVSYETIRRWFLKFGSIIAANLRRIQRASNHIVRGLAKRGHGGLTLAPSWPSCETRRLM